MDKKPIREQGLAPPPAEPRVVRIEIDIPPPEIAIPPPEIAIPPPPPPEIAIPPPEIAIPPPPPPEIDIPPPAEPRVVRIEIDIPPVTKLPDPLPVPKHPPLPTRPLCPPPRDPPPIRWTIVDGVLQVEIVRTEPGYWHYSEHFEGETVQFEPGYWRYSDHFEQEQEIVHFQPGCWRYSEHFEGKTIQHERADWAVNRESNPNSSIDGRIKQGVNTPSMDLSQTCSSGFSFINGMVMSGFLLSFLVLLWKTFRKKSDE